MLNIALVSFLENNISIRLLSSYLKANGFEAICIFCPGNFNQDNLKELLRILKENNISLVGVSLVTDDFSSACIVTQVIKQNLSIPVIWGGAHVDVLPEESLGYADMVCLGEGEDALLELVKAMQLSGSGKVDNRIKNIWFNTPEGIVRNELRNLEEDLDRFPFASLDLGSQYLMDGAGFRIREDNLKAGRYGIMASRGCPFHCNYCYNNYRFKQYLGKGRYLRMRSIENVIGELSQAREVFKNMRTVDFWDDTFLAKPLKDVIQFRELYLKYINLPFTILAEPMAFEEEKLKVLKECGLVKVQLGIQTGSERVNRQIYNRRISNDDVLKAARVINSLGIRAVYDIIFNNPYETAEDVRQTIKFILKLPKPFELEGYNLIFYPGTEITERALKQGFILKKTNKNDLSSIQALLNSPLLSHGRSVVSNCYYSINYRLEEKEYLYSIFMLLGSKYIPGIIYQWFISSSCSFNQFLLKCFIRLYLFLSGLKNKIIGR